MAFEVELDGLSEAARVAILEHAVYDSNLELGKDPLDILIELEQLAAEYGFSNVFDFIDYLKE